MRARRLLKQYAIYGFLILYGITTVFPFVWMLLTSFKSPGAVFAIPPRWLPDLAFQPGMWDNYREVLWEHRFWRYLGNSTFVSFVSSLGQVITCSMAGFALARMRFPGKNVIFAVLVATMMIPVEVTIIPEFLLFSRLGWLDTFLPLIIPSLLVGSFGTFLMKEYYSNVPDGLEEAAMIDGCRPFQVYRHIFLPVGTAPLATIFVIAFMNNWNDLLRPVLYIQSPALRTVTVGLTEFQSMYKTDWNLLITASFVSILPLLLVYLYTQRYILEGMLTSGLKG